MSTTKEIVAGSPLTTARPINFEIPGDPIRGRYAVITYVGNGPACEAIQAAALAGGARAIVSRRGESPVWECRVTTTNLEGKIDPATEVYDIWQIGTELYEEDIRFSKKLHDTVAATVALASVPKTIAMVYRSAQEALDSGNATEFLVTAPSWGERLYNFMSRGGTSTELSRPVLSLSRVYAPEFASRAKVDILPKVFSTAKLVSDWSIPSEVSTLLSSLPIGAGTGPTAAPTETTWAWKERNHSQQIQLGTYKIQEVHDWAFAAWSTLNYDYVAA